MDEPLIVHCCHCLNCQRQTGGAFVINLIIERDRVEVLSGEPHTIDVARDEGPPQRIYRCPECQVALFSEYGRPIAWFVRGGTLDEPREIVPDVHIYTRSKVDWVTIPEGARTFDGIYQMDEVWPAESLARAQAAAERAAS
jgi:hypothetical protein